MPTAIQELEDKRDGIGKKMRELNDKAKSEKRSFSDDDWKQWNTWDAERTEVEREIEREEKLEEIGTRRSRDDEYQESRNRRKFDERRKSHNPDDDDPDRPLTPYERCRALNAWALGKRNRDRDAAKLAERLGYFMDQSEVDIVWHRGADLDGVSLRAPRSISEARKQIERRRELRGEELKAWESRAAQKVNLTADGVKAADGSLGGYTVPDEMMGPFEVALLQWGGMRQGASIITTATGADFPLPNTDDSTNEGEIIGENVAVNEQEVLFTQLILGAYKYSSKMVKVSVELLQDSAVNLPAFLGEALGTRIGRITNRHFTVGDGTGKPKGITVAATSSGITASVAGALKYTELMSLKHSVDPAYRTNGRFMMHDATLQKMKNMADTTGRPLWLPSLIPGEPPTFDGDSYIINQHMPSTAATRGIVYGDLAKYIIRECRTITLMRLDERFAEAHQVAFLAFARYDGDLRDAGTHPVKYLTLA